MKRLLWLVPIVVLASGWGCGRLERLTSGGAPGPSLQVLAPGIPAPQGYVEGKAPAFFRRDNLYEAIDGMDGEYISYGCRGLATLEWIKPQQKDEKVQAEVYDMGSPLGAFGIYSRAHLGGGEFLDLGEEAAVAEDAVEFARGRFYVRLMGPTDARPQLETMAKAILARVPAGPRPAELMSALPTNGRVPRSERWIPDAAFGMEFLRNVQTARYQAGGKTVELYVAPFSDPNAAKAALEKYSLAVKDRSLRPSRRAAYPGFSYKDDWLGSIGVFQIKNRLVVITGYEETQELDGLLKEVAS